MDNKNTHTQKKNKNQKEILSYIFPQAENYFTKLKKIRIYFLFFKEKKKKKDAIGSLTQLSVKLWFE